MIARCYTVDPFITNNEISSTISIFEVADFWFIDSWPCFVSKQALVAPNSTYIGVIWSKFHADSDFWGPRDVFMVQMSIYIENIDCLKISISKNRFFDEKSISQDGIWIAGRPQSRWDPPGPRKNPENFEAVEGLLNFRRRVCRSFWLDLVFQDPPRENGPIFVVYNFSNPPNEIKHSSA